MIVDKKNALSRKMDPIERFEKGVQSRVNDILLCPNDSYKGDLRPTSLLFGITIGVFTTRFIFNNGFSVQK